MLRDPGVQFHVGVPDGVVGAAERDERDPLRRQLLAGYLRTVGEPVRDGKADLEAELVVPSEIGVVEDGSVAVGLLALAGDVMDGARADPPEGALERPGVVRMGAADGACRAHDEDRRRFLERHVEGRQPLSALQLLVEQPQQPGLLGELPGHYLAMSLQRARGARR